MGQQAPITLYTWGTPNGRKISIMLEECGLSYDVRPVNILEDQQFDPDFLALSPNNKIPAITDPNGPEGKPISLFESGAILFYLAEKTGRFLPVTPRSKYIVMQWLMWQMGGIGPFLGQAHHFRRFAKEEVPYAIERYSNEAKRLYKVLDQRLEVSDYLAGSDYTIADIATYPWIARFEWQGIDWADYPNARRWFEVISARPAVIKGMAVPE